MKSYNISLLEEIQPDLTLQQNVSISCSVTVKLLAIYLAFRSTNENNTFALTAVDRLALAPPRFKKKCLLGRPYGR